MQRVHVGVPAVDQRHLGTRRQITDCVRRAVRNGVRRGCWALRPAEAAVTPPEGRLVDGREQFATFLVVELATRKDEPALATGPLSTISRMRDDPRSAILSVRAALQLDTMLAVHALHPVDARCPERAPRSRDARPPQVKVGRTSASFLIDEAELVLRSSDPARAPRLNA
jgi:hypothetical protein